MHRDLRAFATEEWLTRFPGFVDDLSTRLTNYASAYRQSLAHVAAESDGPPDQRDVLRDLLSHFRFVHNANPDLEEEYEWFRDRAMLALSEIEAARSQSSSPSSGDSPRPGDGPDLVDVSPRVPTSSLLVVPAASGPQAGSPLGSQASSASSSVIDLGSVPARQPRARIVRASDRSGEVSTSSFATGVCAFSCSRFPVLISFSAVVQC